MLMTLQRLAFKMTPIDLALILITTESEGAAYQANIYSKMLYYKQTDKVWAISEAFLREIKLTMCLEYPTIILLKGVAWIKLIDMLAVIKYTDGGNVHTRWIQCAASSYRI